MDRYVVFGNPVAHSLSPRIHKEFAKQTGESLVYGREELPVDGFASGAEAFFKAGGCGANVTVPFKEAAYHWVTRTSPHARDAQAVNTIAWEDGSSIGHNTDGSGLVRDLTVNLGINLGGARVLLIGAGGAARGVLRPLLEAGPMELLIANRTPEKAERLLTALVADDSAQPASAVRTGTVPLAEPGEAYDVVINATSAGLSGQGDIVPASALGGAFCYDLFYGGVTPFCAWAGSCGARKAVDGLGMLVEQAADAFAIWRGVRPSTTAVLDMLRAR
jgi:shikimate dehydrogenase